MGDLAHLEDYRARDPEARPQPSAPEAEIACLASMLHDRKALLRGLDMLRQGHFHDRLRGRIYEAMRDLSAEKTPVDRASVESRMRSLAQLDASAIAAIAALHDAFPDPENIEAHAGLVLDAFERRDTIATCRRVALQAEGAIDSWASFKSTARRDFERVTASRKKLAGATIGAVVQEVRDHVNKASDRRVVGVRYGFPALENLVGLLGRQRQHILAGRNEHGKTALAFQVLYNVASTEPRHGFGEAVYFMCADMQRRDFVMRGACSLAGVDARRMDLGIAEADELRLVGDWLDALARLPIIIDDDPAPAHVLAERVARHREAFESGKARDANNGLFPRCLLQLVAGDHAQKLARVAHGIDVRADTKEKIAAVSGGWLDKIAKPIDVATLLLAQMNRDIESKGRTTRWPIKSDVAGADELAQDADTMIAVHRPELLPKAHAKWFGMAAIVSLKTRFGGGRIVVLGFDKGRFFEPPRSQAELCYEDADD